MNTLTHEERIAALQKILNTLQESAGHQTTAEFHKHGCGDVFKCIQLCKRMIATAEFESELAQADALDVALGISNIQ